SDPGFMRIWDSEPAMAGRCPMTDAPPTARAWGFAQISFIVFMLALVALFVTLGTWQLHRLGEKEALIAIVEERYHQAPVPFPQTPAWDGLTPDALDYRPFTVTGSYDHAATVLVFANLADPVGRRGGVG